MIGRIIDEIGPEELWTQYFNRIKNSFPELKAESEFPCIMKKLFLKGIKKKEAEKALREMNVIAERLGSTRTDDGKKLNEVLLTSTGRQITGVLIECIQASIDEGENLKLVFYGNEIDAAML